MLEDICFQTCIQRPSFQDTPSPENKAIKKIASKLLINRIVNFKTMFTSSESLRSTPAPTPALLPIGPDMSARLSLSYEEERMQGEMLEDGCSCWNI